MPINTDNRWKRWRAMSVSDRFFGLTCPEPNSGCLIWLGFTDNRGYGKFRPYPNDRRATIKAHRMAWILEHGDIPNGLHVLHACDSTFCVNVRHLHLGEHQDNMREMADRHRAGRRSKTGMPFGVVRNKAKFSARVKFRGSYLLLGTFGTVEEAARVAVQVKAALLKFNAT